ncbi:M24 family metallopeptidase [Halioglobus maricola]|uniref:M24 family metallopeptidase n=1 Tax=Halioglobus maricola TaxID=2601894 RepID=A0A5P9NKD3_9GAMM|nr:M24 family metallopeptidase [Halioglobus maricola]QFU75428.1 M24 family metallopeptidase [Halioglobus maricola]
MYRETIAKVFRQILLLGLFYSQSALSLEVLSLQAQAELVDRITHERLTEVLPSLMRREGVDLWVIMSREYNEDPILKTLLPATWMSARRHTMLVVHDPGEGAALEYLAVARYPVGKVFAPAWNVAEQPDQWRALEELITARAPETIAVNHSDNFALADGMSSTEYRKLQEALPATMRARLVSAERLAIAWLETRSKTEMAYYPQLVQTGHQLIARAFSSEVITPGVTTTDDVSWWLRERSQALGLGNWFHPSVSYQRNGEEGFNLQGTILPGDLIHVDFGLTWLRLNTDQQQHAYVLKPGESEVPRGLLEALVAGNQLQDILTANFKLGLTGNEVLSRSRKQALARGINPLIYSHPLGLHGHGAGPTIGMWDAQQGVPVKGDYPLFPDTAYSIELSATSAVAEWGGDVRIMLEEDAFFDGEIVDYMDGRQTAFHLIPSSEVKP